MTSKSNIAPLLSLLLAVAVVPHARAMETTCKMPESFKISELNTDQLKQLNAFANHLLSGKEISEEQFLLNSPAIETTAFAAAGAYQCEKASAPILAIATDPRVSVKNLARILRKLKQEPQNMGVSCLVTVRRNTKTCLELAILE